MSTRQPGFTLLEILIVIAVIGIIASLAIPNMVKSKSIANEGTAVSNIRALVSAQYTYKANIGYSNFAPSLAALSSAGLIDEVMAAGTKEGYVYTMSGGRENFAATARPLSYDVTGVRGYYADGSGVVRYTTANAPPTSTDSPLGQ